VADNRLKGASRGMAVFPLDEIGNRRRILDAIERQRMVALIVIWAIGTGVFLGWMGHKALVRIQVWGLNMDDQETLLKEDDEAYSDWSGTQPEKVRNLVPLAGNRQLRVASFK
jgi:hypothetical protein